MSVEDIACELRKLIDNGQFTVNITEELSDGVGYHSFSPNHLEIVIIEENECGEHPAAIVLEFKIS